VVRVRVRPLVLAAIAIVAVCAVVVVPLLVGRTAKSTGPASPTKGPDVVSSVAPPQLPATRVHRVAPVDARGHVVAGYRVTSTAHGKCFGASLVADGLFRCFRGNTILDPCWKLAGRHAVLCLPEPWSHRLARVQVVGKLPPPAHFAQRWWALRVGDGVSVRCIGATGAAGVVRGEPVTYVCEHGWVLLGDGPDRSAAAWTMGAARRAGREYRVHGTVHLTDAWKAVRAS
jgi:hypothetical protein